MRHITHLRNRDFIRQCKKSAELLILRGGHPSLEEIVRHALAQPAPSYYVDYYRATKVLKRKSKPSDRRRRYASARQWDDMAADLYRIRKAHPHAKVNDIILDLCSGNAGTPKFYLTPRRAMEIVQHLYASIC